MNKPSLTTQRFWPPASGGFTLIEMLLVVVIVGLMISLLLPSLQGARDQARALDCGTRLRQISQAAAGFAQDHGQRLPVPGSPHWPALLLGYYQEAQLLTCPSDARPGVRGFESQEADRHPNSFFINGFDDYLVSRYRVPFNDLWTVPDLENVPVSELDRVGEVVVFGETKEGSQHFYMNLLEGVGNDFDNLEQVRHQGAANYAFHDGSTRRLPFGGSLTPVNLWAVTDWGRAGLAHHNGGGTP